MEKSQVIEIKAKKFKAFMKHFEEFFEKGGGLQEVFQEVGEKNQDFTERRFTSGKHDPDMNAWQPLSPRTVSRKGHSDILIDTTTLKNSIEKEVTPEELIVGTNTPYGKYHQYGTSNIPQRAFLGFEPEEIQWAIDTIIGKLEEL